MFLLFQKLERVGKWRNPALEVIKEITICFRFAIRFLKTAMFVSIGSVVSIAMIDYNKKFGFVNFNGAGYMYIWQNDIVPDKVEKI